MRDHVGWGLVVSGNPKLPTPNPKPIEPRRTRLTARVVTRLTARARQEVHNSKIMALLVRSNELLASSTQGKVGVYAQGGGSGDPSPQTPDPAPCGEEETRTRCVWVVALTFGGLGGSGFGVRGSGLGVRGSGFRFVG
jgi:hypothetical protein